MELFTGRITMRLIKSPIKFTNNITRIPVPFSICERRLCFIEGSKQGIKLFETHSRRLSFVSKYVYNVEKSNVQQHNLVPRPLRRLYHDNKNAANNIDDKKGNIFQKMKQMTKDYWHVLIPVHVVTSIGWMLLFYTAAKNSVDVIWIMEKFHFPERYIDALRGSSAGFWAVAYALYKICTPVRYMVTVGGTTLSIKYLSRMGYLKSIPMSSIMQKTQRQVEHKTSIGKLGCKDPPKT